MDIFAEPIWWVIGILIAGLILALTGSLDSLFFKKRYAGQFETSGMKAGALVALQNYGNYRVKTYNERTNIATFEGLKDAFWLKPMFNLFPQSFGAMLTNDSKENTWVGFIDYEDRAYLSGANQDLKEVTRFAQHDAVRASEVRLLEEERKAASITSSQAFEERMIDIERAKRGLPDLAAILGARKRGGLTQSDDFGTPAQTER